MMMSNCNNLFILFFSIREMYNLSNEIDMVLKLKELYTSLVDDGVIFLEEKPSLKGDLEKLFFFSKKGIEFCDEVLYAKDYPDDLFTDFKLKNEIITEEIVKLKEKIFPKNF